jgi:hypothetical protein
MFGMVAVKSRSSTLWLPCQVVSRTLSSAVGALVMLATRCLLEKVIALPSPLAGGWGAVYKMDAIYLS